VARGIDKGPALGAALRAAEKAWVEAGFPGDVGMLNAIATDAVRRKPIKASADE
jgi:poly(A) polymerase